MINNALIIFIWESIKSFVIKVFDIGFCKNHYRYHCNHHFITSPCHWAKKPSHPSLRLWLFLLQMLFKFFFCESNPLTAAQCSLSPLSSLPSPHATLFFFSLISPWFLCSGILLLTSSSILCQLPRWEEQNTHKNISPHTQTHTKHVQTDQMHIQF